jgi:hypothetical protein
MFNNSGNFILSPSGKYRAVTEFFDDGIKSYRLSIEVANEENRKFNTEFVFRAMDHNFVSWADAEDTLWTYSGDVGYYFWTLENNVWIINEVTDITIAPDSFRNQCTTG